MMAVSLSVDAHASAAYAGPAIGGGRLRRRVVRGLR